MSRKQTFIFVSSFIADDEPRRRPTLLHLFHLTQLTNNSRNVCVSSVLFYKAEDEPPSYTINTRISILSCATTVDKRTTRQ